MIYVSTACVKNEFIKDSVLEFFHIGFTNIELFGGTNYYEGYMDDLLELKDEHGLNFNVHNYFPPQQEDFVLNLIDTDERIAELSANIIREAIDVSEKLGALSYAFHPGYTVEMSPEIKGDYFNVWILFF